MCTYSLKCIFWGSKFDVHLCSEVYFFKGVILMCTYIWKCIFWGSNFEDHLCSEMHFLRDNYSGVNGCWLVWLLLYAFVVADYFGWCSIFFIKLFTTSKTFAILPCINLILELLQFGCNQARYVSGSICPEWLLPTRKSSASLGKHVSSQWRGMVSHKPHVSELKKWMPNHSK